MIFKNISRETKTVKICGETFTLSMISALERVDIARAWDAYNDDARAREKEDGENASANVRLYREISHEYDTALLVKSLLPSISGCTEEQLADEIRAFPSMVFDSLIGDAKILNRLIDAPKEEVEGDSESEDPK